MSGGIAIRSPAPCPHLQALTASALLVNAPEDYFGGFSWYDFTGDAESGIRRSRKFLFELLIERRFRTDKP